MRILLKVAYDGTSYCGFQVQPNAITVEGTLKTAVEGLLNSMGIVTPVELIGASRTDSGVHALGNVVVFDADIRMDVGRVAHALNTRLPDDIRIVGSVQVPDDFHPRKTDCIKTYEYRIWHSEFENPKERLYSTHLYGKLDIDAMREAAAFIPGEKDFSSFCGAGSQAESHVRDVKSVEIIEERVGAEGCAAQKSGVEGRADSCTAPGVVTIRVKGTGFLYNMVRIIAGTLIDVGQGKKSPEDVKRIIDAKDRTLAGPTAPAKGLTLVGIEYPEARE